MMVQTSLLVLGLSAISILLISGCVQQEPFRIGQGDGEPSEGRETLSPQDAITQTKGMGSLCSSLHDCFVFCKGNVGRCTDFCRRNPAHELCAVPEAAQPREWIRDAITQPLPEGSSQARLVLYAPSDAIPLTEVGAYGAHRGGHTEGLDHEWIPVRQGVAMRSWADGYVVWARPAPGDAGYETGQMNVVVYYGDGLWGEHMGLDKNMVLVQEGQRVKAGDPIGYGPALDYNPGYQFGEFNVADQHRRDGVGYWYKFVKGATLVSPFDYLRDDVKQQLVEKWQRDVIDAHVSKGKDVGIVPTPWEPYLTNPMLLHRNHKGTLIGEWFLRSRPWATDAVPDIVVFFTNTTRYYHTQRVVGVNDDGHTTLSGDWKADDHNNTVVITTHDTTYYGIFELDESGEQARLKIEYQQGSYPAGFSGQALIYTERETISKTEEMRYWEHPEDDPRNL